MKVLLLAGTAEGREIAAALSRKGAIAIASLAGATRNAAKLALPTRVGGFGGAEAFKDYLIAEKITHVIDATHPFASRISLRSAQVAEALDVRYVQILRPEWHPEPGDDWEIVKDEAAACKVIGKRATVFLATGRQTLARFSQLSGQTVFCRQIDPPTAPFPFEGGSYVIGRPPFSIRDEVTLFDRLGVDVLVTKNAGGQASRSKLDAARQLGLKVVMIERPEQPEGDKVETVEAALDWLLRE